MRIVIAKKLLSSVGGSEAQARALARALHERHHEVTLVGLRPAWRRPGIPAEVYAAPSGPVEGFIDRVRYLFIPARFGWLGSAIYGIFPSAAKRGTRGITRCARRRASCGARAPKCGSSLSARIPGPRDSFPDRATSAGSIAGS